MVNAKSALTVLLMTLFCCFAVSVSYAKGKSGQTFDNKAPFKSTAPKIKVPKIYKPKKIKKPKSKF